MKQPYEVLDEFFAYWSEKGGNLTKDQAQACATFAQWIAANDYVLVKKDRAE